MKVALAPLAASTEQHLSQLGERLRLARLRPGAAAAKGPRVVRESAQALWAFKRQNQQRDLEAVRSGRTTGESMSWFTRQQARKAKIIGEAL